MKRLSASVLIFLLLLFGAAAVDGLLKGSTQAMCTALDDFKTECLSQSEAGLKESFEKLKTEFENRTRFFCVFIQRERLGSTEKDFIDLAREIDNGSRKKAAALCESIEDELRAVYSKERLLIENVF